MPNYEKIKCIFCDLDGTLFPERNSINDITDLDVQSINRWLDAGKAFVIVTGRDRRYSDEINKFFKRKMDYIGSNGATILHDGQEIYHNVIEKDKVLKLLDFVETIDSPHELFMALEDDSDATRLNDNNRWLDRSSNKMITIEEYRQQSNLGASKFVVITQNLEDTIKIGDRIKAVFDTEHTIVNSSSHSIDIVNRGVDKWHALLKYCELLNYDLDEVVAIGNEENDYLMIKNTPISFAIEDSIEKVLDVATHIVPSVHTMISEYLMKGELENES